MISHDGENLVFLLSLPRSGSTILSLLLGSHSTIHCPPEPWFLLKLAALTQPGYPDSIFDDEQATIGTKEFLEDALLVEAAGAFALAAYNRHLQIAEKTIFIDKTPRYYHILPFLERLFPKARKIWLKRNPLDVALSYKNSWSVSPELITGQKIIPLSFDFAVGLYNLADHFSEPSPYKLEIQYETLIQSPREVLTNICCFLGLEFEAQMLNYAQNQELISQHQRATMGDKKVWSTQALHTESMGRWAQEFALTEIQQLVELLGLDIFRQMGYSDTLETLHTLGVKAHSEVKAAEARHRISVTKVDKITELKQRIERLQHRLQTSKAHQAAGPEQPLAHLVEENRNLKQQLEQLQNSRSWRITAPLRKIVAILRALKSQSLVQANEKIYED